MGKIFELIKLEEERQRDTLMMIPSENYASKAVRDAVGSVLSNKYAEGYPGRRYYQGNKFIDEIENLAIERGKKLFGVEHVNVQPYSGSPANSAILFGLLESGDTIMGLSLSSGGHLTHGHPKITFSGKYYNSVQFGLNDKGQIDYKQIDLLAKRVKPKLMLIGTTAYPLILDWSKFLKTAEAVGAYLVADISHVSGLVVGDAYPSPSKYVHIISTTTHKTLRGPRGAMIMVTSKGLKKDPDLPSKIDKAVFPGLQGGPHNNTTAGIAIALEEASSPEFKKYAKQIVNNAKVLAKGLKTGGIELVADGTECHLMVLDLRKIKLSGNVLAESLEVAGMVTNYNSVPNDIMPPFYPSGLRLGTPAITARGMKEAEMKKIAGWILKVVEFVKYYKLPEKPEARSTFMKAFKEKISKEKYLLDIADEVKLLCKKFPIK